MDFSVGEHWGMPLVWVDCAGGYGSNNLGTRDPGPVPPQAQRPGINQEREFGYEGNTGMRELARQLRTLCTTHPLRHNATALKRA